MNSSMRLKPLQFALWLAFASGPASVLAQLRSPYPPLPPALSTSVAPNIIFYIDTSASMLENENNQWILTERCNANDWPQGLGWSLCVDRNIRQYRTFVDQDPRTKMNVAKGAINSAVNSLISANSVTDPVTGVVTKKGEVRVGLFSFDDSLDTTMNPDGMRAAGSILRAGVTDVSVPANKTALDSAINALNGRTATPLGEGLLEITQYLRGGTTLYRKPYPGGATSYVSPIQYRCQKNFAIVVTDGSATQDDVLPTDYPTTYTGTNPEGRSYSVTTGSPISYTTGKRDAAGNAVTKTFGVCSVANAIPDNDSDVNCPAALEGTTTPLGFSDASNNVLPFPNKLLPNRFRAIRDVAKYGRVADLRPGPGNDLAGKSFDDPKFPKQNLNTYTVGLSFENLVLPAAAIAGGGKYYKATDGATLSSALNEAINSIGASQSNGGGLATQSGTTKADNKLFQPVFDPNGWRGELRCFAFGGDNKVASPCSPNSKANIPTPTSNGGRNLITSNREMGETETNKLKFEANNWGQYSDRQKTSLGANVQERQDTVNYVRGVPIAGTRSRIDPVSGLAVLLGDIIDGQPEVVSQPFGVTFDTAYKDFRDANESRNIVLIGANAGMLHAFRIDASSPGELDNMSEIMGYVPSPVYPNLKALMSLDYGTANQPHAYFVNGSLKQADMKLSNGWTTVVAGGLGQGGQGYFALDVKNEDQLRNPSTAIKWEFTDQQRPTMGYSFGTPILYNVRATATTVTPAVILSNGYDSDFDDGTQKTTTKASALYIINAETGAIIHVIDPQSGAADFPTGWGGGLSSPAGVDVGQDGILDYVYAGDLKGRMWRFDLTGSSPSQFFVEKNPIFDAGPNSPIVSRPAVMPVNKVDGSVAGNIVLFGTGKLLTDADRTTTTQQYLYGILDKLEQPAVTVPNTLSATSLQQQTIAAGVYTDTTALPDGSFRSYRRMSNNAIDLTSVGNTRMGWRVPLPEGERSITAPAVFANKVMFGTGNPLSNDKCLAGGTGWIMGLNPLTGSSVRVRNDANGAEYSFMDTDEDGLSTPADRKLFTESGGASTQAYVSGVSLDGLPTEVSYVSKISLKSMPAGLTAGAYADAGSVVALRESNSQGVYAANGPSGRSISMGTPREVDQFGSGTGCAGTVGNQTVTCIGILNPSLTKARVLSTIWREIK
jgi:type IV pilus assembly protein PilY1